MAELSHPVPAGALRDRAVFERMATAQAAVEGVHALQPWQAYATVFTASACTLVIELLAGRLMAPHLGVSLYTWTSVIGVVLAGMTLGNFAGGRIADRRPSRLLLSRVFLAAAASCLLLVGLSAWIFRQVSLWDVSPMVRILAATTAVFFVPSLLLGTTSPQVVKLTLRHLERAGQTVGSIYAVSALGSIVGTFLTGFLLVDYVGTLRTLWLTCGVLFVCGVLVRGRLRPTVVGFVAVFALGTVAVAASTPVLAGPCEEESAYFCIRTVSTPRDDGATETSLVLDHLVHTSLDLDDPTHLGYSYETAYKEIGEARFDRLGTEGEHLLIIGGGGYAFPRYMRAVHPEVPVEVVEIDPGVVEFNHARLGLPRDTPIVTHPEDARTHVNTGAPEGTFSVVQLDAFNDVGVPYHLTTLEFAQAVKRSMSADGVFMANVIDAPRSGQFVQAYANTLRRVFPAVTVYVLDGADRHRTTYVVAASAVPLGVEIEGWERMPYEQFVASFPAQTDLVLTDDFAPTDRLLRPIFDDAMDTPEGEAQ